MFVVDINVLVYAADQSVPEHARCRAVIEQCRRRHGAWFLTWGIAYEFLRVVTHPRVLRQPSTMDAGTDFIAALREPPGLAFLTPTNRHPQVLAEVVAEVRGLSGNIIHDAQTAVLMREHGIRRVCIRDTDFHRFPFLEPVDPLSADPL